MGQAAVARWWPVVGLLLVAVAVSLVPAAPAAAQFSGVLVDAKGVLSVRWFDQTGQLHKQRLREAKANEQPN